MDFWKKFMILPRGIKGQLFSLTIPIFIETLLMMLFAFIDIVMLSQLSENAVASVNFVNQLLMMVMTIFMIGVTGV